jgi:hypothetical protein
LLDRWKNFFVFSKKGSSLTIFGGIDEDRNADIRVGREEFLPVAVSDVVAQNGSLNGEGGRQDRSQKKKKNGGHFPLFGQIKFRKNSEESPTVNRPAL